MLNAHLAFHSRMPTLSLTYRKFQNILNTTKFNSHTSTLLKSLHWLPISERINFKIVSLTFKVLNYSKPSYLAELLTSYQPLRSLHSSGANLLSVPDIRSSNRMGRRSFKFAAPKLWNFCHKILALVSTLLLSWASSKLICSRRRSA